MSSSRSPSSTPGAEPSARRDERTRRFRGAEIAIVLSRYDLGVIDRVREYRRGSRRAPKLRIAAERGQLLLKRLAPGRGDAVRVTFAHAMQRRLAEHGYPLAALIPTRTGETMVELDGRTYELFTFVEGKRDDRSIHAARLAGRRLAELHALLAAPIDTPAPPSVSYHDSPGLEPALRQLPSMVTAADSSQSAELLEQRCDALRTIYRDAARRVQDAGYPSWPTTTLHGDWHPGNLIYRDGEVVAVLDFDSVRLETRLADVANGALQFSMRSSEGDPATWPYRLDVERIRALLRGYDEAAPEPLSADERNALPWLMLEALILESVVPIAATGRFAHLPGASFLELVERTVGWLQPRAQRLLAYLGEPVPEE